MKLTTTLQRIKDKSPCIEGYKKLATHLGGCKAYGMDTPINLLTILESNGVQDMLWCLRATAEDSKRTSSRLAIEFAADVLPICERRYPNDSRPREAIQAARDYLQGKITLDELRHKRSASAAAAAAADADAAAAAYAADAAAAADADAADAAAADADAAAYAAAAAYDAAAAAYAAAADADAAAYAAAAAAVAASAAYADAAAADAAAADAAAADADAAAYAAARTKAKARQAEIIRSILGA